MSLSIQPQRIRAGSSFSTWLTLMPMSRSLLQADRSPSMNSTTLESKFAANFLLCIASVILLVSVFRYIYSMTMILLPISIGSFYSSESLSPMPFLRLRCKPFAFDSLASIWNVALLLSTWLHSSLLLNGHRWVIPNLVGFQQPNFHSNLSLFCHKRIAGQREVTLQPVRLPLGVILFLCRERLKIELIFLDREDYDFL